MRSTPLEPAYLRFLFDRNAEAYDPVNRLISLGMVGSWRGRLLELVDPAEGQRVLDAFCGPGSLGLGCLARVGPRGRVCFTDISPAMLEVAQEAVRRAHRRRRRAPFRSELRLGPSPAVFIPTDLVRCPEPVRRAGPYDTVLAGFALRYVPDPGDTLQALGDMLRPGGTLGLLEFTPPPPTAGLWTSVIRWYFEDVLPPLAGRLAGEDELYRALRQTTGSFSTSAELEAMVEEAGFGSVRREQRAGGLVTLIAGSRPSAPRRPRPAPARDTEWPCAGRDRTPPAGE